MNYYQEHKLLLEQAIEANRNRTFYSAFAERIKAYSSQDLDAGKLAFQNRFNQDFTELKQGNPLRFEGEEVSPFLQLGLGIRYPSFADKILILNAKNALKSWHKTSINDRAGILIETLKRMEKRFSELAYANMHTSGQALPMSFQSAGPHAADRALEAIAMGYAELTRFPKAVTWSKPMGRQNIELEKNFIPQPKGISLVIGCSTFPTWNTMPGMYASLITGNPVIVKPHPKAVLPIAIVVGIVQDTLIEAGLSPFLCQLAVDSTDYPIAKDLINDKDIKLVDFTGNPQLGNWLETLQGQNKTVFTEKSGVNCVILDSTNDAQAMLKNLAFSLALYSGQMCTAPQNIFVPETGISTPNGDMSYDQVLENLVAQLTQIIENPDMALNALGALQNDITLKRLIDSLQMGLKVEKEPYPFKNSEFNDARTGSIALLSASSDDEKSFSQELFGPIAVVIKTKNTLESLQKAKALAQKQGALSCLVHCTHQEIAQHIVDEMNEVFIPVTFNLMGGFYVNQNAAFSDFHGTGGSPAGNAAFTDPNFINKRFVWVGNRYQQ